MIEFVIFTGVFLFYYAVEVCIEYFIFGNAKGKNGSSIQTEQRKLLEAHAILKEVVLESVSQPTQQQHNTTNEYKQEEIYHTVSFNTSLAVYSPTVEALSFFPFEYLGCVVALFVLVFVISKWIGKPEKKQNKTSSSNKSIKQVDDNTRTLKECVEVSEESSDEWFDACQECINDEVLEEWFDASEECSDLTEDDMFEEWFDASEECTNVTEDDDVFEDCFEVVEKSRNVDEAGVFVVSDEVSSADESEGVLIAFGDFSLDQTKQFMETTGFVLTLPEKKSENHVKNDEKRIVQAEPILVCTFNMDDTSEEFGNFSKTETTLQDTKTPEKAVSNEEESEEIEKKVEEREEESEKQEKVDEAGINTFRTDLQISQSTNKAPLDRELQKWKPAEDDDETDELQSLEKEGQDLKDETILSPEEMFKSNPDLRSTFLEDLSQYTTKLDTSSLSREQIEFAEKMANEIMKENKQRKNKQRRKNNKHRNKKY